MIRCETRKNSSVIHIDAAMNIRTVSELTQQLMVNISPTKEIEIDLSQVDEIDIAGLQLLVMAKTEAINQKINLRLTGHSNAVLEVFDLCNLGAFFGDPVVISHSKQAS